MSDTPMPATSIEMLERLVGFDTVSSKSNLALIDFVETYLQGFGVASRRTASADASKANLYATLGPEVAGVHDQSHWMVDRSIVPR